MNLKGISYYLSMFTAPFAVLAFLNILFSSYFDYFLNIDSYVVSVFVSLILSFLFFLFGNKSNKMINFQEQLVLIILIYFFSSIIISIPFYFSNYHLTFINSIFEAFSGITGTGFTVFKNIKYLDPTLILWRAVSQWIGGLYFLILLILFFSNSVFNYKLNNLVFSDDKSLNPETKIKEISIKILLIYGILTIFLFFLFSFSGIRLFNSLNIALTTISTGGFLPTNSLSEIVKTNLQKTVLIFAFLISLINFYFVYNLFKNKISFKKHYEDLLIVLLVIFLSIFLLIFNGNSNFINILSNVLSSIGNSGITTNNVSDNFNLYLISLTIIGGSVISATSGIKFIRIYILLKSTFLEMLRLVRPFNVLNRNIFLSDKKIESDTIKITFLIFISFFISLFILSSILLFDDISFENAFKLSILTLTNTTSSELYGLQNIDFSNLLTSSKFFIIIFMIIGKIELISVFLLIKKFIFKS